jgi:arylsulfatase A-like enzyme/Tfp pilus assembly protein PilF
VIRFLVVVLAFSLSACSREPEPASQPVRARSLLLVTIDTLRMDRVGAYGDASAGTPAMDRLAARGARFANAFAVTPITLPSHASMLTGRYPAGHGARHNGMRIDLAVPTLAESLSRAGFATGAFVAAFPLDRRFGLIKGFQTYSDTMPRGADGRLANERPGQRVVDEALAWLQRNRGDRFFLWVHLFEPHAPYGDASAGRTAEQRYAREVSEADRQAGRLIDALGADLSSTLVVVAADHGEAFGEHGEIAHSIFVYDTTLRIPMILAGPGIPARVVETPVSHVDIAPTVMALLGAGPFDADGIDLGPALNGTTPPERTLYAESFAPLLDFGWSPLRTVRRNGWKYIAAPKAELYHMPEDATESRNVIDAEKTRATEMRTEVERFSGETLPADRTVDADSVARLQALGYVSGSRAGTSRPDPKDKRELASRIARVTSGEVRGAALERLLREILEEDPQNPLANLRLGYVLADSNRCADAVPRFRAAIAAKYPSADAHLGLAGCEAARREFNAAAATLKAADTVEPGNPVVLANLGLVLSDAGQHEAAIDPLQRALTIDPDLHQARFALAIAYATIGRRQQAAAQAEELLRRLPSEAPQRAEVERLLAALR